MKKIHKTLLPFLATGIIASTIVPLASCTFKREKDDDSTYTITLDLDGGTIEGVDGEVTVVKGATVGSLPTPKKPNFNFKSWINSKDQKVLEPTDVINSDMSLKATYDPVPQPEPTYYIFLSGKDTIYSKTSNNTYTVEANPELTDISWTISRWEGEPAEEPDIVGEGNTRTITTYVSGSFTLTVSSTIAGKSDSLEITIQDPTVNSNKIWFVNSDDNWCSITSWNATNIYFEVLGGNDGYTSLESFDAELFFGDHVEVIDDSFLMNCTSFDSPIHFNRELRVIRDNFLYGATSFNQQLPEPEDLPNLVSIGHNCLYGCTRFNNGNTKDSDANLMLTLACNTIGNGFMRGCISFDNSVTINDTVEFIGDDFMFNCKSITAQTDRKSKIILNCPWDTFSFATLTPLTFAAEDSSDVAWATNGLPVVFLTQSDATNFLDKFNEMTEPFFRNINESWQE